MSSYMPKQIKRPSQPNDWEEVIMRNSTQNTYDSITKIVFGLV